MRVTLFPGVLQKILTVSALAYSLALLSTILPALATETKEATVVPASGELHLTVHPTTGRPGQARTVFVQQLVRHNSQCGPVDATFDTSRMESQNLVIVTATVRRGYICGPLLTAPQALLYRFDAEITPTTAGPLTIRWTDSGAEVTPAFPEVLTTGIAGDQRLNRLDLAKWIVAPENVVLRLRGLLCSIEQDGIVRVTDRIIVLR